MFGKIIQWSIHNKFLVLLSTLFLIAAGLDSLLRTPLDAIPDLSDVQVIIYTEYPGQAPQIVEDQVTYPLTTQMLAVPNAKVVRGYSFFGFSFVYIIFEDGTDMYWARSRVLEYLNYVSGRLPKGVTPTLGPDATGVGWAFMYALKSDRHDLSQLRSIQDRYLKYGLTDVPGVAEVASIGGFVKQYQVTVDPNKLRAYDIPISKVRVAIQRSNNDVGGRLLEVSEKEFMIRGLGYIKSLQDLDKVAVGVDRGGTPILLKDIATVQYGPELRRGLAELDGQGETVGGIIVVRSGANVRQVIQDVKAKLAELKKGLPAGVQVQIAYDRSELIERAVETLRGKLLEESIVVAIVCIIFLLHFRSALVAIITLPVAILISFIVMHQQGINANIMSLGGIAIAIGAMVDAAIIMIENAHKHIERDGGKKPHWEIISDAATEVGPALFYSILVITVSFVPVFTLEAQEGRLFKPLAFTKTYAMGAAALLSITLVPVLMGYFIRGRILPEHRNPINRLLIRLYHPVLEFALHFKYLLLAVAVLAVAVTAIPFERLGSEFMPPLWEGDLLYMPTTLPGVSITKAREILQQTDKIIQTFPEVEHVFGKAGRAETATDPAPLSMFETIVSLKPEDRWRPGMTWERLLDEMDRTIRYPGMPNIWWMPIQTRTEMLATGVRSPLGIKVYGPDLGEIGRLAAEIEHVVATLPGTRSAFAERTTGGYYLNITVDRDAVARYGMTVGDVQDVVETAIGGMAVSQTIEGRERYSINVRYGRDWRSDLDALRHVLVPGPDGVEVPLGQLAEVSLSTAPASIRDEGGSLVGYVFVDVAGRDLGGYVAQPRRAVAAHVRLPPGYRLGWAGQFEYLERAEARLALVVPLTLLIVFVLLYLNTGSLAETLLVMLAVPFSAVGAIWLLWLLGYNLSIAVWVGLIALLGVDAETGVFMLLYLDLAWRERQRRGLAGAAALHEAIVEGAVKRLRPKVMTVGVMFMGLLPIMWSQGTGADVMKRIAAPMVGGIFTSFLLELLVYPALYLLWRGRSLAA